MRIAFAANPSRTPEEFEVLAQDPEPSVRNSLLQQVCTWKAEVLEELAKSDDPLRLKLVARSKNIPHAVAERLAGHSDEEIRATLAHNHEVPDAVLARLVGDASPSVQQALRNHPRCPPEEVDRWIESGTIENDKVHAVLNCRGIRERHYRKLLAAGGEKARFAIVLNQRTPLAILEELFNGGDLKKMDHLAKVRRLPDSMYAAILALEKEGSLRHYTAVSYHTPREVAERIALTGGLDDFWERRTRVALVQQRDMRPEFLCQLLERELTRPKEHTPRWRWRRRRSSDSDVLPLLVARPEIPIAKLKPLLDSDALEIRRALIGRADLPAEWRAKLRAGALERSVNGRTSWARLAALCHPETKTDALRTFARAGRWLERLAVARNPAAPAEVLELLGADSNRVVREEARARLGALQRSKS